MVWKSSIKIFFRQFVDHFEREKLRFSIGELFKRFDKLTHELDGLGMMFGLYGMESRFSLCDLKQRHTPRFTGVPLQSVPQKKQARSTTC